MIGARLEIQDKSLKPSRRRMMRAGMDSFLGRLVIG
jgi:hypothetical protein